MSSYLCIFSLIPQFPFNTLSGLHFVHFCHWKWFQCWKALKIQESIACWSFLSPLSEWIVDTLPVFVLLRGQQNGGIQARQSGYYLSGLFNWHLEGRCEWQHFLKRGVTPESVTLGVFIIRHCYKKHLSNHVN